MNLLINNTDDISRRVTIDSDLIFARIQPCVYTAQQLLGRFLGPIVAQLAEKNGSATEPTTAEKALIEQIKPVLACFSVLKYVDGGNASVGNLGVMRNGNDSQKDAFEWQHEGLRSSLLNDAWTDLEALLEWLEARADNYPAYRDFLELQPVTIMPYARIFNQYYHIGGSRVIFQTLLPLIRTIEKRKIVPALTPQLHATLAGGTALSDEQKNVLELARSALAYAVMARATAERVVFTGDRGVMVNAISQFATINYALPPDDKQVQRAVSALSEQAEADFSALKKVLSPVVSTQNAGPRGNGLIMF